MGWTRTKVTQGRTELGKTNLDAHDLLNLLCKLMGLSKNQYRVRNQSIIKLLQNFRTEPLVYNYCMLDVSTQIYCPQTVTHNIANSSVYDEYDDLYVKISLLQVYNIAEIEVTISRHKFCTNIYQLPLITVYTVNFMCLCRGMHGQWSPAKDSSCNWKQ